MPASTLTDAKSTRSHLCGYDLNLTYPQNGHFPPILPPLPSALPGASQSVVQRKRSRMWLPLTSDAIALPEELAKRVNVSPEHSHQVTQDTHKRSLLDSANGTINPTYGCNLFDEMIDFALNYSVPWREPSCCSCPLPTLISLYRGACTQWLQRAIHVPLSHSLSNFSLHSATMSRTLSTLEFERTPRYSSMVCSTDSVPHSSVDCCHSKIIGRVARFMPR